MSTSTQQVVSSGLTEQQRQECIAGLKAANHGVFGNLVTSTLWNWAYLSFFCILFRNMPQDLLLWGWVNLLLLLLPLLLAHLYLTYRLFNWVRVVMKDLALPFYSNTDVVRHVFALSSDSAAYRGWEHALIAGELNLKGHDHFNLRRRLKALYTRFGVWSRDYGYAAESWPVRILLYTPWVLIPLISFVYVEYLIHVNDTSPPSIIPFFDTQGVWVIASEMSLLGLWAAILHARRAGLRLALIDYFTAESQAEAAVQAATGVTQQAQPG